MARKQIIDYLEVEKRLLGKMLVLDREYMLAFDVPLEYFQASGVS